LGWYNHRKKEILRTKYMGIHPTMNQREFSMTEKKEKTTQYVNHCASSSGLAESIALKDA
jgi:hypothetical protein